MTRQSQGKNKDDPAPETPEGYEFQRPESVPEDLIDVEKDPMVASFKQFAHERGIGPKLAQDMLSWYLDQAVQSMPEPPDPKRELEALGRNGQAVIQFLGKEMTELKSVGLFNDEDIESFKLAAFDGAGARMMMKLISHYTGGHPLPTSLPTEGVPSKSELDQRYNEVITEGPHKGKRRVDVDPAYRQEMQELYEKVYGTEPAGTSQVFEGQVR